MSFWNDRRACPHTFGHVPGFCIHFACSINHFVFLNFSFLVIICVFIWSLDASELFFTLKKTVLDDLMFVTRRVILLEVAISRRVDCAHKMLDIVSNNTQDVVYVKASLYHPNFTAKIKPHGSKPYFYYPYCLVLVSLCKLEPSNQNATILKFNILFPIHGNILKSDQRRLIRCF